MRAWCLIAAGCGGAVAPAPAPLSHHTEATCAIQDVVVRELSVHLALHGREFAVTNEPIDRLAVVLTGTQAHASLETQKYALEGELPIDTIAIRTTKLDPHDGWLVIGVAQIRRAVGDRMELAVELPFGLEPRTVAVTKRCSELTFQPAAEPEATDRQIDFATGTRTPLRRTPGGEVLATIAPTDDTLYGDVLEQRGSWLRVQIGSKNLVIGWVPAHVPNLPNLYGGLLGNELGEEAPPSIQCTRDAPIYLDHARVGTLRAHAAVPVVSRTPQQIEIYLGADAHPNVLPKDCT